MVSGLIATLIGWGVPQKAAKPILFVGMALLLVLALWGGKCAYDAGVIDDYRTKVELDAATKDRKADQGAADRAADNAARLEFEIDQLEKAVSNAPDDPNVDDALERRLAYHRCLRLQQAAREHGREPPRCV